MFNQSPRLLIDIRIQRLVNARKLDDRLQRVVRDFLINARQILHALARSLRLQDHRFRKPPIVFRSNRAALDKSQYRRTSLRPTARCPTDRIGNRQQLIGRSPRAAAGKDDRSRKPLRFLRPVVIRLAQSGHAACQSSDRHRRRIDTRRQSLEHITEAAERITKLTALLQRNQKRILSACQLRKNIRKLRRNHTHRIVVLTDGNIIQPQLALLTLQRLSHLTDSCNIRPALTRQQLIISRRTAPARLTNSNFTLNCINNRLSSALLLLRQPLSLFARLIIPGCYCRRARRRLLTGLLHRIADTAKRNPSLFCTGFDFADIQTRLNRIFSHLSSRPLSTTLHAPSRAQTQTTSSAAAS